jgi:uncharacterized membrane protein
MFRGLINDAKTAAGSLVAKYLARASVAVPFIAALGFAIAAITLTLVERFGAIAGYWMVAGGFTLIGLVAALVVSVKEHEEEIAEKQAEQHDTAEVGTEAAAQAAVQLPIALLGALFSSPGGATAAVGGAKMLGRNIPLVVLIALIGMLFWPTEPAANADESEVEVRKPNGMHPPADGDLHREAA